jgi:hypothetical protein
MAVGRTLEKLQTTTTNKNYEILKFICEMGATWIKVTRVPLNKLCIA